MKISFLFLGLTILSACSFLVPGQPTSLNQTGTENQSHFVNVVLPAQEKSLGATVTLTLEDREPMQQIVAPNSDLNENLAVNFLVGESVAPATLKIEFANGEIKELGKVIFDTTLTLQ